jgi:hypothetical protein
LVGLQAREARNGPMARMADALFLPMAAGKPFHNNTKIIKTKQNNSKQNKTKNQPNLTLQTVSH